MRHIEPYLVYITYYYIIISLPELAKLVDFLMLRFFSGQIVHEIIIIKQKATNNGTKKTQEKPKKNPRVLPFACEVLTPGVQSHRRV